MDRVNLVGQIYTGYANESCSRFFINFVKGDITGWTDDNINPVIEESLEDTKIWMKRNSTRFKLELIYD